MRNEDTFDLYFKCLMDYQFKSLLRKNEQEEAYFTILFERTKRTLFYLLLFLT